MTDRDRSAVRELGRQLGWSPSQPVKMTGSTTAGGRDRETQRDGLPLPIGTEGQVVKVVDVAGDLVPQWADEDAVTSGDIADFNETAQDAVGGILTDSTSIDLTYDDGANTITAAVILEWLQDTVAAILTGGSHTNVTTTYQDATGVIDLAATGGGGYTDEQVRDVIGSALVAGNNVDITVDDALDTITIDVEALTESDIASLVSDLAAKAPLASPTFTGTVTLPVGLTGVLRADTGTVSVDSDVTDIVAAASDTAAGKVELATTAETTTGTDATRAVTPDGLHDMTSLAGAAWFLDEDAMTSNSDTKTASQQSIKAYVDAQAGGGAPSTAKYIVQEVHAGLSAEQSLGALTTGLLKNTVTGSVGVLSTAVAADLPAGIDATKIADGSVTNTEFQHINSVTSNVQTQLDALSAGTVVTSGIPLAKYASNQYYAMIDILGQLDLSTAGNALVADTMQAGLYPVASAVTFNQVAINLTAAVAGSTIRLGVYAVGSDGLPGALIADWGTVSSATPTGDKTLSISWSPVAGWYYLVMVSTHAPSVLRQTTGRNAPRGHSTVATLAQGTDVTRLLAGSSAALPNPFGAAVVVTNHRPIWLRVA